VASVVDDQHESETGPDIEDALSDASGDMVKTPTEDDSTTGSATSQEGPSTSAGAAGDDVLDDAASDTVKSPGAGGDAA
jgi:hypothetical protein